MMKNFLLAAEKSNYIQSLEKEIFDLKQLLEISKSLNSTLNYNILMDSILYTVMGQLQVLKVGLFIKKGLNHDFFTLHRNVKGFEIGTSGEETISEHGEIVRYFTENPHCCTLKCLRSGVSMTGELKMLLRLNPDLVVPLKAKGQINGIIILGDRIDNEGYSQEEQDYLINTALFASIAIHNAFLFEMSTTDMMTQLRMRHYFYTALVENQDLAVKEDTALSLIMLDIDHFKNLNDTWGHPFGDQVLKEVAATIRENVRQIDVAARYGGEEFVVLLPKTDRGEALAVAERIRNEIADLVFHRENAEVRVTISIGVAEFDKIRDYGSHLLVSRADQALYQSKESGRNRTTLAD